MIFSIIIFGNRHRNKVLGQVQYLCPRCRQNSYHTIMRSQNWFALYWIPVIPLGKTNISRCNVCGYQEQVDNERVDAWFERRLKA
jgi:zinc-ribbon family